MEGEGQQAAVEGKFMDFDGIKVPMRAGKNPSDIIWLNRGISRKQQLLRSAVVIFVIMIVFAFAYFTFSLMVAG